MQNYTMSPAIRTSPAGLLVAALFPPKMKDPRWYIRLMLTWLQAKGAWSGFKVWDAYTNTEREIKFVIRYLIEDYRGIYKVIGCRTAPSQHCPCWKCKLRGEKVYGATTYLFFVMLLPQDHYLRKKIRVEFAQSFSIVQKVRHLYIENINFNSSSTSTSSRLCTLHFFISDKISATRKIYPG